jgi:hypothetical protein
MAESRRKIKGVNRPIIIYGDSELVTEHCHLYLIPVWTYSKTRLLKKQTTTAMIYKHS